MEEPADTVLNLLDSSWFYLKIFEKQQQPKKTSEASPSQEQQPNPTTDQKQPASIHKRSKSDQLGRYIDATTVESPESVLSNDRARLDTILSQKEYSDNHQSGGSKKSSSSSSSNRRMRRKRLSKSMSQLEYEELKGFVDLGFVFLEEDKADSGLVGMIPGLQRMGHERKDTVETDPKIVVRSRPYLSEAWSEVEKERDEERLLMSWRVPIVSNDEVHIKENLRSWAHTVASAVRC